MKESRAEVLAPLVIVFLAVCAMYVMVSEGRKPGARERGQSTGGCGGPSEPQKPDDGPADAEGDGDPGDGTTADGPEHVVGQFVLKLNPTMLPYKAGTLTERVSGFKLSDELDELALDSKPFNEEIWLFKSEAPLEEVMARLSVFDEVEYVEPVLLLTTSQDSDAPSEPVYCNVDLFAVAPVTEVVVAVIDTGVHFGGADGMGARGPGYDFVDRDFDPSDPNGHGTRVAVNIAAASGTALAGDEVAPGVQIMAVRVLNQKGFGLSTDVASGIAWAVDNGADVINLSLSGNTYSALVADAVEYAYDKGVVVVAAAGNDGFDGAISYPAANPGVIAVGAMDVDDVVTTYSNKGPDLDVVAPSADVDDRVCEDLPQESEGDEGSIHGTSMAAPHVSALAAVLIADGLTEVRDVTGAILESANDQGERGFDHSYGWGLVDGEAARGWQPPSEETDAALALDAIAYTVHPLHQRVEFTWTTTVLSDTCLSLGEGRGESCKVGEPRYTEQHRRLARLDPCKGGRFVLRSASEDGLTVTESVIVPPDPGRCSG